MIFQYAGKLQPKRCSVIGPTSAQLRHSDGVNSNHCTMVGPTATFRPRTVISGGSRNVRTGGRRCDPTLSRWGFGGRCKPPNPEANAFWQQSIENWLKIRSLGRPRVLNILYCSWDRAHAHATTSRLTPDRENPKAALFCLANRCSRSKMTER